MLLQSPLINYLLHYPFTSETVPVKDINRSLGFSDLSVCVLGEHKGIQVIQAQQSFTLPNFRSLMAEEKKNNKEDKKGKKNKRKPLYIVTFCFKYCMDIFDFSEKMRTFIRIN